MSNGTCEVIERGRKCNQPAVSLVSQTTLGTKAQPAVTITNRMCDRHAKEIAASNPSATVARL